MYARLRVHGPKANAAAARSAFAELARSVFGDVTLQWQSSIEPYDKFPGSCMAGVQLSGPDFVPAFREFLDTLGGPRGYHVQQERSHVWAVWRHEQAVGAILPNLRWAYIEVEFEET